MAAATRPAATAAALPPDDPPGVCLRDHGFRVWPKAGPLVKGHWPSSQQFVLPTITAPAPPPPPTQPAAPLGVLRRGPDAPAGSERGGHPGDVDVVLDRDGDAQQ